LHHLLTFVLLAFACYRITRLAILDTIFDAPRDAIHTWLLNGNDEVGRGWRRIYKPEFLHGPGRVRMKLHELLACPYCLSIWVAGGLQLAIWNWRPVPLPLFYFLALSGASLAIYQYIDFQSDE
jgi:hypothetical protein